MLLFIEFQKNLRLDQLEIVKEKYNDRERMMTRFYHGLIGFLVLSMAVVGLLLTRPETLFYQITEIFFTFY